MQTPAQPPAHVRTAVALVLVCVAVAGVWLLRGRAAAPLPAVSLPTSPPGPGPEARGAPGPQPRPLAPARTVSLPPPAPLAPRAPALTAREAPAPDGGDPALFGNLVRLGQGFALGEALAKNAENADKYLDKLCDESRRLREKPPMPPRPTPVRDAAEFMAPLMDYEAPLNDPPGRLHLPDPLRQRLGQYTEGSWLTRITDQDLAGLDFGWMEELAPFDHWSLLRAGRLKDQPMENALTFPIPNYVALQFWTKLRFALATRRGDLAAASTQVRHLADLTRTQGLLISEMIAVALYKLDATARTRALAAGFDVGGWLPVDTEQLDRVRPVEFSSMYFTYPGVSAETVRKAVACMPSPCTALAEGAGASRSFGAYAAGENLALLQQLAAERGCETALFDRVAKSAEVSAPEALQQLGLDLATQIPRFLDPPR